MKEIWILSTLFFSLSIYAQTADTSGIKFIEPPDSTGFGTPDGKLVNKQIGATGGTIMSDDGRVTLIFPAGALTENTTISIQPTTNPAPNGAGKAYQFEPSGIQFKKPVQILFHYTDKESAICPPEWMSLAVQDKKGKWIFTEYEGFDSVAKTLKGYMRHFCGASNINDIRLTVDKFQIPVDGYTYIDVLDITRHRDSANFDFAALNQNNSVLWYVEGVLHGDAFSGKIETARLSSSNGTAIMTAKYSAPAILPPNNSVTIWAEIYGKTKTGKKLRKRLYAWVNVYDAYKVQVIHEFTGRAGMGSKLIDSASFIVWVYSYKREVSGIRNYSPKVLKEGRNGPFKEKINVDDALGTIHITEGIKNDSLSKDYPPEVYFEFTPNEVLLYKSQYSARGIPSDITPVFSKSLPEEINFIANGQVQRYNIYAASANYKLIVTPFRQ